MHVLEQELAEQRALAHKLSRQLRADRPSIYGSIQQQCFQAELDYWVSKVARQRRAINHIQRKGWYPPAYVIHEQEEPCDLMEASA